MPEIALELPSNGRFGDALDYPSSDPVPTTAQDHSHLDRQGGSRERDCDGQWHRSERRNAALGGFWGWQSWQWYSWWVQAVRGCCGGIFTKDSV
jgi:hypothetical protein